MAKVTGPLFSMSASGQIGKALVYAIWKGRAYVREYVVGSNPNTLPQRWRRTMMGFLSKMWANLDSTEQDSWVTGAAAREISPFNQMTSVNMDRQTNALGPAGNSTPAGGALTGGTDVIDSVGGVGKINVELLNDGVVSAGEYNIVTASQVSEVDSKSIARVLWMGLVATSNQQFDITELEPGDYYLSTAVINEGGTVSAFLVDGANPITVT